MTHPGVQAGAASERIPRHFASEELGPIMCRFLAYSGEPVFLSDLVCAPTHSLVHQSLHADEGKTETNGDGFGIGWYGERAEPGVYRDISPAWSDENLVNLCGQVRARTFFAHVRAATGTATARANCHPFAHGRHLFMHNGQIGGYCRIKRRLEALIPDDCTTAAGAAPIPRRSSSSPWRTASPRIRSGPWRAPSRRSGA